MLVVLVRPGEFLDISNGVQIGFAREQGNGDEKVKGSLLAPDRVAYFNLVVGI